MKRYLILTILVLSFVCKSFGQSDLENTLLWKVSDNGLVTPSYLIGTIHVICKSDSMIKPKVQKVLDEIDCITFESDFTNQKQIEYYLKSIKEFRVLRSELTKEEDLELTIVLCERYNSCDVNVESWSLKELINLASGASLECKTTMYDLELLKKGIISKKRINGLDTVDEQLQVFKSSFSISEIIRLLKSNNDNKKVLRSLVNAFLSEDMEELYKLFCEQVSDDTKAVLLDDRNRVWVKRMIEGMKKESVLYAVGSGHLYGEFGLLNLLKEEGYTLTPVVN